MGAAHTISFAILADGTAPASLALEAMLTGEWAEDPEAVREGIPSDTQIQRRNILMSRIKYFSVHGECDGDGQMNALQDGIWEFKEGEKRVSFFDTVGAGKYVAKHKIRDRAEAEYPDSDQWQVPGFDLDVRLGHCFGKPWGQRTTEQDDLDETLRVREEDLAHDA